MWLQQSKKINCVLLCVVLLTEWVKGCDDTCQSALLQGFERILQQKVTTLQEKIDRVDDIFLYFERRLNDMEGKVLDIHVNSEAINGRSSESLVGTNNLIEMQTQIIEGIRNINEKTETLNEGIRNITDRNEIVYEDLEEIKNTTFTIKNVSSTYFGDLMDVKSSLEENIQNVSSAYFERLMSVKSSLEENIFENSTQNNKRLIMSLEKMKNDTSMFENSMNQEIKLQENTLISKIDLNTREIHTKMNETEQNIVMLHDTIRNNNLVLENNMKQEIEVQGNNIENSVSKIKESFNSKHQQIIIKIDDISNEIKSKKIQETKDVLFSKLETITNLLCLPPFKILPETQECLYVSKEELSWDSARRACQYLGADLAVPKNFSALHKLLETIPKEVTELNFYVGGNDYASPGTNHTWINGEAVTGPWLSGNPDFTKNDNCLMISHIEGKLSDYYYGCSSSSSASFKIGYICQKSIN